MSKTGKTSQRKMTKAEYEASPADKKADAKALAKINATRRGRGR